MVYFLYWFFENFCLPIKILAVLADTSIIVAVVKWIYGLTYCTTYLKINNKIEKLELRRKYFTVQHLTNIVSREYYQGDLCDKTVRAQIIKLTSPRLKDEFLSEHFPLKLLHSAYVRRQVKKGVAVDISSDGELSLFSEKGLVFRGIECSSVAFLLKSFLCADKAKQKEVCKNGVISKKDKWEHFINGSHILYWDGIAILREGQDYARLLKSILKQLYVENESFHTALNNTKGKKLFYSKGDHNPQRSFITEREICNYLMQIRDSDSLLLNLNL